MSRKYYTLLIKDGTPPNTWEIAFGDYDRANAASEYEDYRDHGFTKKELRIIVSGDTQAEIDAIVATLNAKEGN